MCFLPTCLPIAGQQGNHPCAVCAVLCRRAVLGCAVLFRAPSGAGMLARITQLINSVLAEVQGALPVTEQDVVDLIGVSRAYRCEQSVTHGSAGSGAGRGCRCLVAGRQPTSVIWKPQAVYMFVCTYVQAATPGQEPLVPPSCVHRVGCDGAGTEIGAGSITHLHPAIALFSAASAYAVCVLFVAELGQSQGGPAGRHWVLDPIDGTRGFVGMRQYAVCLGMLQDGEVALGVLGCPNLPQGAVQDDDGGAGGCEGCCLALTAMHCSEHHMCAQQRLLREVDECSMPWTPPVLLPLRGALGGQRGKQPGHCNVLLLCCHAPYGDIIPSMVTWSTCNTSVSLSDVFQQTCWTQTLHHCVHQEPIMHLASASACCMFSFLSSTWGTLTYKKCTVHCTECKECTRIVCVLLLVRCIACRGCKQVQQCGCGLLVPCAPGLRRLCGSPQY